MPPEQIGKKFCWLDINMLVDDNRVNLEIQVKDEDNYPERALYYFARIYSSALPAGEDYNILPRTIIISILDFELFDCDEVHSEYQVLEVNRHIPLTDKLSMHFFELPKMKEIESIDINNEKDLWLALFNAETEEELEELSKTGGEVMSEAIQAYRGVTATDEFRNLEWIRTKTQHDEAQALYNAKQRGAEDERVKWQVIVADRDAALVDKDVALADKDAALADRDAALANKDAALADKDIALADRDAALAELRAHLAEIQPKLEERS